MTVRAYYSSDASAPALRGNTAGDLINLLTKCLVDGYGAKAGAGWTKPFTGTNVAVFKSGAGSNAMHLRVDDTSTASSNRAARVVGYGNMTDVNTGTGQFPTSAQVSGGLYWFTMNAGTAANARVWELFADETFFILRIQTYPEQEASSPTFYREHYWFGDLKGAGPADAYATVIQGQTSASSNSSQTFPHTSQLIYTSSTGCYVARSYTGIGGSVACGLHHDQAKAGTSDWGSTNSYLQYPHGPNGGLMVSPVWVHEPGSTNGCNIRGTIPGLWAPLQNILNNYDTFTGQGDLAGKTFRAWRQGQGRTLVETSNTW